MPAEDAGESGWDFDGDPVDAVDGGDLDGKDGTSDRGEVAHVYPHGEPAEDAKEAYWDVKGDPADTVDNGDPEGSNDTSGGGVVDDGIHVGDLV